MNNVMFKPNTLISRSTTDASPLEPLRPQPQKIHQNQSLTNEVIEHVTYVVRMHNQKQALNTQSMQFEAGE